MSVIKREFAYGYNTKHLVGSYEFQQFTRYLYFVRETCGSNKIYSKIRSKRSALITLFGFKVSLKRLRDVCAYSILRVILTVCFVIDNL